MRTKPVKRSVAAMGSAVTVHLFRGDIESDVTSPRIPSEESLPAMHQQRMDEAVAVVGSPPFSNTMCGIENCSPAIAKKGGLSACGRGS
jgi:tetrahydromethanopterin S-methyltransferase subunit E